MQWRKTVANHEIRHEVGIKAAPAALYHALTDAKQLALWWIPDTRGTSAPGPDARRCRSRRPRARSRF